jgi:hypothetical protein
MNTHLNGVRALQKVSSLKKLPCRKVSERRGLPIRSNSQIATMH